ncbi:hypothetical protein [Thermococcus sp.]|uniref:hypothetical protein n=1 Tax=Thermococcus sp. TaxID=35749 RepID=UPI00260743EF|nr:hypothetical protein [Thermococcus sp.]
MLIDIKTLYVLMEIRSKRGGKKGSAEKMLGILEGRLPKGMSSVELLRRMREEEYD